MRIQDIIAAKRDCRELTNGEISRIVMDYAAGEVPDYQMSAFLMAAYINGMSFAETSAMTQAMIDSGEVLDLSSISKTKVDKHSTGGVGDKTTLVVIPVMASCGLAVPKMSGRGLGFTGGTLDKLESIPGFNMALSPDQFVKQVNDIGAAIAGQTHDIVPADKKIYALRDVTATVESIPLIAASIMSKKIACSSDIILLDVKVGSGAFMHDLPRARELARTMIAIGTNLGRKVGTAITDMNQPLGRAVGNALEVAEAIDTLKGDGPADFRHLCVELSAIILYMAAQCKSLDEGRAIASGSLDNGSALKKFAEIISSQDGNPAVIDDYTLLPQAKYKYDVVSERSGFVSEVDCALIGRAACMLGAGRERKEDSIDPAVGIITNKKLGDRVENGEALAELYSNDESKTSEVASAVCKAYTIGDVSIVPPLIHELTY
ncbi:MAG: thymidine phosphorylase [Armatimonadota bacterium]